MKARLYLASFVVLLSVTGTPFAAHAQTQATCDATVSGVSCQPDITTGNTICTCPGGIVTDQKTRETKISQSPAPAQPSGCYSPGYEPGSGSQGVYVGQPDFTRYKDTGCPPGTTAYGTNGAPGTAVPNNLTYVPLEPLPGESTKQANFCQLVNLIFKLLIYLGGMAAVLFLVLGGITYMVSEVVDKRSAARDRIKAAVYGLIVLLAAWIILNTVNPNLVNNCSILSPTNGGILNNNPSTPSPYTQTDTPFYACKTSPKFMTVQTIPQSSILGGGDPCQNPFITGGIYASRACVAGSSNTVCIMQK